MKKQFLLFSFTLTLLFSNFSFTQSSPTHDKYVVGYFAQWATVTGGAAALRWNGSDADGDFLSYNVYVDQKDATTLVNENSTENLYTITNTSTGTYYWKIISKDSKGNKSESDLFYFKVN